MRKSSADMLQIFFQCEQFEQVSAVEFSSYSINVKKSINSDGAALFQYEKRASETGGEEGERGRATARSCVRACLCEAVLPSDMLLRMCRKHMSRFLISSLSSLSQRSTALPCAEAHWFWRRERERADKGKKKDA